MRTIFVYLLLCFSIAIQSQTKLLSWNLANFGSSKSDQEITFIANTIQEFDIIAIQEVVAGNGGAQAVARLADELNRKGNKWDYAISNPTSSSAFKTERYAFLWKTNTIKLKNKPWLEPKYHLKITREPYFATFIIKGKALTVASFHALPKGQQPETEIKYFQFLPLDYPTLNLVFAGDFNCPQSHTVFKPLKNMGYKPILTNQKTSLKQKSKNNKYLASEYDNMYYNSSKISIKNSGVLLFYKNFDSLKDARKISDHIPIWVAFSIKD